MCISALPFTGAARQGHVSPFPHLSCHPQHRGRRGQVSSVCSWSGARPLCGSVRLGPQLLPAPHTHAGAPCCTRDPATCFHTLFQEGKPSLHTSLLQNPGLVDSSLMAAESPEFAAGTQVSPQRATHPPHPSLFLRPPCPLGGQGLTWTGSGRSAGACVGCTGPGW